MWRAWIGLPSEKLWPFEFLEGFRCSITNVWIYNVHELDLRVKSFDHLHFSSASVVKFRASDMWCAWIGLPSEKLWPFQFLESFLFSISNVSIYYAPESDLCVQSYDHLNFSRASVVQLRTSQYILRLNRTSVWKVLTIWISRELPLFNYERHDMWCAWIGHPSEKLLAFEFFQSFRCSILCVSICDAPELDLRVNSFDHLNFSRAPVVQFRASRYIMRLNLTSVWTVISIWISREFLLFNFSVSIYYVPESDLRFKSYVHLNFSRASVVQFRASQ